MLVSHLGPKISSVSPGTMAYSSPSPSESCSNWSSNFSDCSTANSSTLTMESLQQPATPLPATSAPSPSLTRRQRADPAPASQGRRYAADDDWRRHRGRITAMYKAKRLKDVMVYMESEFAFFATERMYKARFKDWGLQKNVTAVEVHKLMQKVEQHQKHQQQSCSPDGVLAGDAVVAAADALFQAGGDVDVKRIQKYMKRKPVGLKRLRTDPQRPLEALRALSSQNGTSASRVRTLPPPVPVSVYHQLEFQHQPIPMTMPLPLGVNSGLRWTSPETELPEEILQLLQGFINGHYGPSPPYCTSSSGYTPTSPAAFHRLDALSYNALFARDELMLDFALNFRIAHSLLDEGYMRQGIHALTMCFESLSGFLRHGRPIVLLYVLSSALEVSLEFNRSEVLHMLFRHLSLSTDVLGGGHPIAQIAKHFAALGARDQAALLKVTRELCRAADVGDEPAFAVYSRTVDIATDPGLHTHEERLQALRVLCSDPAVQRSQLMALWAEMRVSLARYDLGQWGEVEASLRRSYPAAHALGCSRAPDRVMLMLKFFEVRIGLHRAAGGWAAAEKLAGEAARMAEVTWGGADEVTARFAGEMKALAGVHLTTKMEEEEMKWQEPVHQTLPSWNDGGWQQQQQQAGYGMGECGLYESSSY